MIPEGRHTATAIDATLGETMRAGKQYVEVVFRVGEETATWFCLLEEQKGIDRAVAALRLLGWGGSWFDLSDVRGRASITVEHEPDDKGKIRCRVAFVNALAKTPSAARIADLQERSKYAIEATPQGASSPPSDDEPPPRTDEDYGF